MVIQKNCEFITEANSPIVSKIFPNATGDLLILQISGATGVFHLEGRMSSKLDWVSLGGINLTDFSTSKAGFTQSGMYEIDIVGIRELRARVESVDGNVTMFGQIISTEEI